MRTYELMIILKTDFLDEDQTKRNTLFDKLLSDQKAEKLEIVEMGKKQLAYEIGKQKEGIYYLLTFQSPGVKVGEIEQQVKLQTGILRYLLTRKDK